MDPSWGLSLGEAVMVANKTIIEDVLYREEYQLFVDKMSYADEGSLIMSAKANDLNPFFYLAHVFKKLPAAKTLEDIEILLP